MSDPGALIDREALARHLESALGARVEGLALRPLKGGAEAPEAFDPAGVAGLFHLGR